MRRSAFLLFGAALLASGCAMRASGPSATAMLQPKSGSSTMGTVNFATREGGDKVLVSVDIIGLKPNGEHGFHVHEKGDCSGDDAMKAGGHFNPMHKMHGGTMAEHHAGDMPNLKSDANGRMRGSFEISGLSVGRGPDDIVGRSVVIHRDPDDYKSQPSGNSGPRIACGVISRV